MVKKSGIAKRKGERERERGREGAPLVYTDIVIQYSGKLLREKTFTSFVILQPPVKVFSTKS